MQKNTTMYLVYTSIGYLDPSDGSFFSDERVFSYLRAALRYFNQLQEKTADNPYMSMGPDVYVVLKPILI